MGEGRAWPGHLPVPGGCSEQRAEPVLSSFDDLGNIVTVEGIDILDGTPLLDIKPYIPTFDQVNDVSTGWMQKSHKEVVHKRSDSRFI